MASNTQITKTRRNLRNKNAGKKRKNLNNVRGTTPKFAIHKEK